MRLADIQFGAERLLNLSKEDYLKEVGRKDYLINLNKKPLVKKTESKLKQKLKEIGNESKNKIL